MSNYNTDIEARAMDRPEVSKTLSRTFRPWSLYRPSSLDEVALKSPQSSTMESSPSRPANNLGDSTPAPRPLTSPQPRGQAQALRPILKKSETQHTVTEVKLPQVERAFTWIYPPAEGGFTKMIQHMDFKWWGSTMGTGIVSILLHTFSETYPSARAPLRSASIVFFVINAALFSFIFTLTIMRLLLYPKLFGMMIRDPGQAMYLGTFPMGFATLITMTVRILVPLGGPWRTIAVIAWWADVIVSLGTALVIPWLLQVVHVGITDLSKMTAGWLLPIVAPIVAAATGSAVASTQAPPQALITIISSYAILGVGLPTALCVITIYFLKLTTYKLPPVEHMASSFLPLGPLGQGGFAVQQLGVQALRVFPATATLPAVGTQAGAILYVLGWMIAITLWGFGLLWMFFAALSVTRQKFPFSLGWWAFTFPLGVFATSTLTMGQNLPSMFFTVLGTIFGSLVMVFWVMVASRMLIRMLTGNVYSFYKAPEVMGDLNKRYQ